MKAVASEKPRRMESRQRQSEGESWLLSPARAASPGLRQASGAEPEGTPASVRGRGLLLGRCPSEIPAGV